MPTSSGSIEPSGTSGWIYTASTASSMPNCWRHNGFGHTITNGRIQRLVASHQEGYWRRHNPLLLMSIINGGITGRSGNQTQVGNYLAGYSLEDQSIEMEDGGLGMVPLALGFSVPTVSSSTHIVCVMGDPSPI